MPPELDPAAAEGLKPLTQLAEARRDCEEGARTLAELKRRGFGHKLPNDPALALLAATHFASYYTVEDEKRNPGHLADSIEEARFFFHEFVLPIRLAPRRRGAGSEGSVAAAIRRCAAALAPEVPRPSSAQGHERAAQGPRPKPTRRGRLRI